MNPASQVNVDEAVESALGGSPEDFARVIEAFHVPVRALLMAMVQDRDDADDLAQQTFIHAFQHLSDYSPRTSLLAWLKNIARLKALAYLKRKSQRRRCHGRYVRLKQTIARRANQLVGASSRDQRLSALRTCMDVLPEPQRVFLKRVHQRGESYDMLAEKLGRTAVAVRKQASRLRAALKKCVEQQMHSVEFKT
jgi:RNA polymerase sigma-70 factor (ECF subfamily)